MVKVTKKRAAGGVVIAAAVLAIMNQFGIEDTRLPPEVICAVYPDSVVSPNNNGVDAWYGIEFAQAREVALGRGAVAFYAIPKTALVPLGDPDLKPPYPPDMGWMCTWTRERTIREGVPLDASQDYPGRFTMAAADE